ncbi:hypothetical protein SAMN04487905_106225 [Actinopolyspora xinjiangensis]|uniref:Uncharacterized protein n=1 Tax=Actinopolyspora xinjiangensis TaxID=405564 RepID=A0A1H0UEH0_9ACTN|nr:hypothetical protein [Actinopolyspora xinjiangensis]SDP64388.1 hypothetical protein SAMN04487905_106225 [Actinopolyspora xinjiangensis]
MTELDTAAPRENSDERLLREGLHTLVRDVEPSPTALSRVLAKRRGRSGSRLVLGLTGVAAAATAALLLVLVLVPDRSPRPVPVGIAPDSYVVRLADGTLASAALETGEVLREFGRVDAEVTALAKGDEHVYAAVAGEGVLRVGPDGTTRRVRGVGRRAEVSAMSAANGRLAVAGGNRVTLVSGNSTRRITLDTGLVVRDLALDRSGRLALVVRDRDGGAPTLRLVPAGRAGSDRIRLFEPACAPLRIAWSSTGLLVLRPRDCAARDAVRLTTIDPRTGGRIGGGVGIRFEGPIGGAGDVRVSTDSADRVLVSTATGKTWLVDGGGVELVAEHCVVGRNCTPVPAAM